MKLLATISIWVLFILAIVSVIWSTIAAFKPEPYNFQAVSWAFFIALSLFLTVVAIKIRKALD